MKAVISAYARSPFHPSSPRRSTSTTAAWRSAIRWALAAQCIGGGQGIATILEKI